MAKRPRDILSNNVRALMEARPALGTIKKIVQASQGRLSNGKVGRVTAGTHATDVDTLEGLAEVFGVQPWQLLIEGLNPKAPPVLASGELLGQIRLIVQKAEPAPAPITENDYGTAEPAPVQRARAPRPDLQRALDVQGMKNNAKKRASGAARTTSKQRRSGGPS